MSQSPITVFNKPLTKPETKTFEPSTLTSPDMKVPSLNAKLAVRDMGGIMRIPARQFNRGTPMRRISRSVAVAFGAVFGFLLVSATDGSSATILWRNYNNPDSPTMRLLNERHLDGIIDGIVSYNVLLQENNTKQIFCLPSDSVLTVQQAEEIINHVSHRLAKPDDVPISVLLIVGLQEAFPCS